MNALPLKALTPGLASGPILLLSAPLSLWGGLDVATGMICDATHPDHGKMVTNSVLAMPSARGSSSSSSALVESVRRGTGPAAIILARADPILVIGSLVAADLYSVQIPILLATPGDWTQLKSGKHIRLECPAGRTTGVITDI